jgi:hypothetical protein
MAQGNFNQAKDLLSKAKEDIDKMNAENEKKRRERANIEAAKILAKTPAPAGDSQVDHDRGAKLKADQTHNR